MADEIIRLDYSAEDIGDNIDEVREARGEYDSLDERLDEIEGGGFTPTQAQLDAMNSGITDDDVEQIDLNKNNISFNANNGVKNLFNIKTVTNISSSLSISGDVVTMTTDDSRTNLRMMVQRYNDSTLLSTVFLEEITTNGIIAINFTKDATFNALAIGHNGSSVDGKFRTSVANLQNGTEYTLVINVLECMKNPHFQWGYIMICPKSLYDNDSSYQPYAMSNAEITAWILAHS